MQLISGDSITRPKGSDLTPELMFLALPALHLGFLSAEPDQIRLHQRGH